MPISLGTASLIGSGISGIGSLFGAGKGASAADKAAQVQAQAAQQAAQLQLFEFGQLQQNLAPWRLGGQTAFADLRALTGTADVGQPNVTDPFQSALVGPINTTFTGAGVPYGARNALAPGGLAFAPQGIGLSFQPTMDQLAATPGYQFALQQGLLGTQNAYAAQGLGSSGSALKGAANYATGLASTTYQQQFGNWLATLGQQYNMFAGSLGQQYGIFQGQNAFNLQQRQQQYNMLGGLAGTGQNAAAFTGSAGLQAAGQVGNALTAAGAATAGGIVGSANALNAGIGGATNALSGGISNFATLNALGIGSQPLFGGGSAVSPIGQQIGDSAVGGLGISNAAAASLAPGTGTADFNALLGASGGG